MPLPSGDHSGDSWVNAASIWQLNQMIARAGPNGTSMSAPMRALIQPKPFELARVAMSDRRSPSSV
jgi:hypothetical protein